VVVRRASLSSPFRLKTLAGRVRMVTLHPHRMNGHLLLLLLSQVLILPWQYQIQAIQVLQVNRFQNCITLQHLR